MSWTYEVTNVGEVELSSVVVTDDQGVVVTCPGTTLDPGETMICTRPGRCFSILVGWLQVQKGAEVMQVFLNKNGPLPLSAEINTDILGGRLLIAVSGTTAQPHASSTEDYIVGVLVQIDGEDVGQATIFVDGPNRQFFANTFEVPSPPIGQHKVTLVPFKETPTSDFDLYNLNIQELGAE